MAPKLINRGTYFELQQGTDWTSIINSILGGVNNIIDVAGKKRKETIELQDARVDLRMKLTSMDPEIQKGLLQSSPEMRRFLLDPEVVPKDQMEAMRKGKMEPLMPKIRPRTPLEEAKLTEAEESARREAGLADEAESKAALQADVTKRRQSLMGSQNVYEQIMGLTGEVLTQDKLEAAYMGVADDPRIKQASVSKYLSGAPGTVEFKTQTKDKALAELLQKVNPQTPQDMAAVEATANYIAGLGPRPGKMPKTLERFKADIDAMQARTSAQQAQIAGARLTYETNAKIHALGDALSVRLPASHRGQAFGIAEGMIKSGKFPTDLPPDMASLVKQETDQVQLLTSKLNYEKALQQSPKLEQLLEFAAKSATAGDDKGAQAYVRMAEVERKRIFGEDKKIQDNFWQSAVSGAIVGGATGGVGVTLGMQLGNLPAETKQKLLKWAGTTVSELYNTATESIPGAVMDAAGRGIVTSPGQPALRSGPYPPPPAEAATVASPQPAAQPIVQPAPPPSGPGGKPSPEQLKIIEDMVRSLERMDNWTPELREKGIQLLDMIAEVKQGKRPFSDLITPDR